MRTSAPAWYDPSYRWTGRGPRFSLREQVFAVGRTVASLLHAFDGKAGTTPHSGGGEENGSPLVMTMVCSQWAARRAVGGADGPSIGGRGDGRCQRR